MAHGSAERLAWLGEALPIMRGMLDGGGDIDSIQKSEDTLQTCFRLP